MDAVTRRAMSPYFLRQLEYYGVDPAALAGPVHAGLVLSGDPAQSDLAPQSVGPRQAAVFALSELTLGPGQRLLVSGRAGQRVVLVLASLSMADDARLVLTANTDLVVDQWCPGAAPGGTRVVLLTAPGGQAGPAGSRGATGVNGVDSHTPGGPGTFGGAGGNGSRGLDSPDALITIARLGGDTLFEVSAGKGGDGGAGGKGGQGGQGGIDPATRKMAAGGAGAAGGPGGHGGSGGNGGRLRVWIEAIDPGASFTTRADQIPGGTAGAGGAPGIPGMGHPDGAFGQPGLPGNPGSAGAPGVVEVKLV